MSGRGTVGLGGLAALGALGAAVLLGSRTASASTAPSPGSPSPTGPPVIPSGQPPTGPPQELPADALDFIILWSEIDCSRDGHSARIVVSSDCAMLMGHRGPGTFVPDRTGPDRYRVRASNLVAQVLADRIGALLPTTRVCDLAWQQAMVAVPAHTQSSGPEMATLPAFLEQHDWIEKHVAGRPGLVRTVGKEYVLSNKMVAGRLCFYGWHDPRALFKGPTGLSVYQPLGIGGNPGHLSSYFDYSHALTFMGSDMLIDGELYDVKRVLRDPQLCRLLSDEGPVPVRHPDVPDPFGDEGVFV